jgi:hypothetical protein
MYNKNANKSNDAWNGFIGRDTTKVNRQSGEHKVKTTTVTMMWVSNISIN